MHLSKAKGRLRAGSPARSRAIRTRSAVSECVGDHWSREDRTQLDQVRLPAAVQEANSSFLPQAQNLLRSGEPGNQGNQDQAPATRSHQEDGGRFIRFQVKTGAKEGRRLQTCSRPTSRQRALASTSMQVRDSARPSINNQEERLDDLGRPARRLLPRWDTSKPSTLLDNDNRRRAVQFQGTAVRPINSTKGVYEVHQTDGKVFTGERNQNVTIPGRLNFSFTEQAGTFAHPKFRRRNVCKFRTEKKGVKGLLGTNKRSTTSWNQDRYKQRSVSNSSGKEKHNAGCSKITPTICIKSQEMGFSKEVSKPVWPGDLGICGFPPGKNGNKIALRCSGRKDKLEARRATGSSGGTRSAISCGPSGRKLLQSDMEASSTRNDSHRCLGHRLGSGDEQSCSSPRVLRPRTASVTYYSKGAPRCSERGQTVSTGAATNSCQVGHGQHECTSRDKQRRVLKPSADEDLQGHINNLLKQRNSAPSRIHSNASKCVSRRSLKSQSQRRVVNIRQNISTSRADVWKKNVRSIRLCGHGKMPSIQFHYPVISIKRRRIASKLGRTPQLGLPSYRTCTKSRRETYFGGIGSGGSSAILAISPVVSNANGIVGQHSRTDEVRNQKRSVSKHLNFTGYTQESELEIDARSHSASGTGVGSLVAEANLLVEQSVRPSTHENYQRLQLMYESHCQHLQITSYPTSWESISTFALTFTKRGLKPDTIRSYLSAISVKNNLLGHKLPEATVTRLHRMLQGIENKHRADHGPKKIQPAIASSVVLKLAQKLISNWNQTSETLRQACALTIFGFLFAARASTILAVKVDDVKVSDGYVIFTEGKQKSKSIRGTRQLKVPIHSCILADAIAKFVQHCNSKYPSSKQLFGEGKLSEVQAGAAVTKRIHAALKALRLDHDGAMSSHSLRRGAAVAMNSLNVPVERMLSWGAWASQASLRPYVMDRAWSVASEADRLCFGWMVASK